MNVKINTTGTGSNGNKSRKELSITQNLTNPPKRNQPLNTTTVSKADFTRWLNEVSSVGRKPTANNKSRTSKRNKQKSNSNSNKLANLFGKKSVSSQHLPDYVAAVMDPAHARPCRIPSTFCYPSSVQKLTYTGTLSTNASGNCYLAMRAQGGSTAAAGFLCYNNDATLTAPNFPTGTGLVFDHAIGDRSLTNVLAPKRRTVGASLQARYIGADEKRSGTIIGAFIPSGAVVNATPAYLKEQYYAGSFNTTQTAEVIWLPREDVDMDYTDFAQDVGTSHCCIAFYGGPPSVAGCIEYEINILIEYVPGTTNYLSHVDTVESDIRAREVVQRMVNANPNYVVSPGSNDVSVAGKLSGVFSMLMDKVADVGSSVLARAGSSILDSYISGGSFNSVSDMSSILAYL